MNRSVYSLVLSDDVVEAVDRPGFLPELLERMYEELPEPRAKKKK